MGSIREENFLASCVRWFCRSGPEAMAMVVVSTSHLSAAVLNTARVGGQEDG